MKDESKAGAEPKRSPMQIASVAAAAAIIAIVLIVVISVARHF